MAANSLLRAPSMAARSRRGSTKKLGRLVPSMTRREVPRASSSAALANSTTPSGVTTATSVASRSKAWKRSCGGAPAGSGTGAFKPSLLGGGRAAHAGQLALDAGDVVVVAGDVGLEFLDAVEVLLVVATF